MNGLSVTATRARLGDLFPRKCAPCCFYSDTSLLIHYPGYIFGHFVERKRKCCRIGSLFLLFAAASPRYASGLLHRVILATNLNLSKNQKDTSLCSWEENKMLSPRKECNKRYPVQTDVLETLREAMSLCCPVHVFIPQFLMTRCCGMQLYNLIIVPKYLSTRS